MQDKKKRTKKAVKVGDLKPAKDPKGGGMPQGSPQDVKSLLKHLQLGLGSRQVGGKIAAAIACDSRRRTNDALDVAAWIENANLARAKARAVRPSSRCASAMKIVRAAGINR